MIKKKIFLASSSELKADRVQFEILINRKNKNWVDKGIFLELIVWEDFLDAISQTRLQDEYNKAIRECDLFVMLFCTKVGQYTEEEFEIAFGEFKAFNKPFIFTYFKDVQINTGSVNKEDLLDLLAFQKKLDSLEHFYTVYKNIDELKYKFIQQLDKLATNGFIELKLEDNNPEAIRTYLKDLGLFHPKYFIQSVTELGDFESAQEFLDAGMGPDSTYNNGPTALCYAAGNGDLKALEFLLDAGADINAGNEEGCNALGWATEIGKEDAVRFLLKNGANSESRNNAFIAGVKNGNIDALKILLDAGIDLNTIGPKAMNWASHSTNSKADVKTIKFLLDLGIDSNVSETDLSTPLITAVWDADNPINDEGGEQIKALKEKIKVLLDGGADINTECNRCSYNSHSLLTPLMVAVLKNNLNIAEVLLHNKQR